MSKLLNIKALQLALGIILAGGGTLYASSVCFAQSRNADAKVTIKGRICSAEDGAALDFVNVLLKPSELWTVSDASGNFSIKDVPSGKMTLSVQFFGKEPYDTTFVAAPGSVISFKVKLQNTSFRLDNVVVTATSNKAGSSTASTISRQAMDHIQTSSLKDIMGLLPGVAISNPSLSDVQQVTIRTAGGASSSMNSMGTAVIVDGSPMSNNANMQVLSPTVQGSMSTGIGGINGGAAPSGGVDIRALSTDNVESVEVIRGIPSVSYGDMTSGAVIVKSKAGKAPLVLRLKANPNIYQASVAKGFGLGKKAGDLNISGDYAYNLNSLTQGFKYYQRANAKALWSVLAGNSTSINTALTFTYGRDTHKMDPDDERSQSEGHANEIGFTFNNNGSAVINKGWFRSLNWTASFTYNNKDSFFKGLATNALNLYSTAMEDNMTYTNHLGEHVFIGDKEITNAPDILGRVLPYSYIYRYNIYGKELNGFAKFNLNFGKSWDNINERILVGADYKTDGNLGIGAVFEDETPPYRAVGSSSGYRRRPFNDVPFIHQVGAYVEDNFDWTFARRTLVVSAGVRFDYVNGLTSWAPRVNASLDLIPDVMTIRGGWGITSKAPTAMYLYPNKAYADQYNFNGMDVKLPEQERLLVATTRVYDVTNPNLQIAKNRKAELGFDFTIAKKYRISITGYDELMKNGYTFGQTINSFKWMPIVRYAVDHTNPGTVPTLKEDATYNMFFETYEPGNNGYLRNSGVEYEIDFGRFNAIRTSLQINGAWMRSASRNMGYSFSTSTNTHPGEVESNIGIYKKERSTSYVDNFNTTIRITHNIPRIGFVVTLTSQLNWWTDSWTEYGKATFADGNVYGMEEMFESYISRKDGKVHPFDPSERKSAEFDYLFPTLSDSRFMHEKYFPTVLFNLNVTKEVGDWLTASFYVNNIFNSRPLYRSKKYGTMSELGIPIFFGLELKVTIK